MRLWSVAAWVVALSLAAFCQSPDFATENAPPPGQFSDGIYRNPALGLTYLLSSEWQDSTSLSESNPSPARGSRILLIADRHAGFLFRDRIVLAAQSTVGFTVDVQQFNEKFAKYSAQHDGSELLGGSKVVDFGGEKFYRADSKKGGLLSTLYRAHLCTEIQGYFLLWTFVSPSDSRLEEMVGTLKNLSIAPDKKFRFRSPEAYPSPAAFEKDMRQWLLNKVPPVYSKDTLRNRTAGDVVLGLIVGPDGSVKKASVISGPMPLREAATKAAMQWKYRPYLLQGKPVSVETEITIHFAAK